MRAVRAGCALAYRAQEKAQIFMLIRPVPGHDCQILEESITHDRGERIEQATDAHGNTVLKTVLLPGLNEIRHDGLLLMRRGERHPPLELGSEEALSFEVLRYALPSRYCESDKLSSMATRLFGFAGRSRTTAGVLATVQDICDWTHYHIAYRHGSGDQTLSACEAIGRGYGVCRDFAHVMIALCRALDIPARYAAGHIPLLGAPTAGSDIGIDFHAYVEVYLAGRWQVFDPRHNTGDEMHIKTAHGMDAVDAAIASYYGSVQPAGFQVWSHALDAAGPGIGRRDAATPGLPLRGTAAGPADDQPASCDLLPARPEIGV